MKQTIIRVSNQNTFFYVIGATVSIGKDKNGNWVKINNKKIYGLSHIEIVREIDL